MNDEDFVNFKPKDFLKIAESLNEKENEFEYKSSLKRTIYTRIYYATFLFVREYLKNNSDCNIQNKGTDHEVIPSYIYDYGPFDKDTNEEISNDIKDLKKMRHQCDYYLELPQEGTKEWEEWQRISIKDALLTAEFVINQFSNLI